MRRSLAVATLLVISLSILVLYRVFASNGDVQVNINGDRAEQVTSVEDRGRSVPSPIDIARSKQKRQESVGSVDDSNSSESASANVQSTRKPMTTQDFQVFALAGELGWGEWQTRGQISETIAGLSGTRATTHWLRDSDEEDALHLVSPGLWLTEEDVPSLDNSKFFQTISMTIRQEPNLEILKALFTNHRIRHLNLEIASIELLEGFVRLANSLETPIGLASLSIRCGREVRPDLRNAPSVLYVDNLVGTNCRSLSLVNVPVLLGSKVGTVEKLVTTLTSLQLRDVMMSVEGLTLSKERKDFVYALGAAITSEQHSLKDISLGLVYEVYERDCFSLYSLYTPDLVILGAAPQNSALLTLTHESKKASWLPSQKALPRVNRSLEQQVLSTVPRIAFRSICFIPEDVKTATELLTRILSVAPLEELSLKSGRTNLRDISNRNWRMLGDSLRECSPARLNISSEILSHLSVYEVHNPLLSKRLTHLCLSMKPSPVVTSEFDGLGEWTEQDIRALFLSLRKSLSASRCRLQGLNVSLSNESIYANAHTCQVLSQEISKLIAASNSPALAHVGLPKECIGALSDSGLSELKVLFLSDSDQKQLRHAPVGTQTESPQAIEKRLSISLLIVPICLLGETNESLLLNVRADEVALLNPCERIPRETSLSNKAIGVLANSKRIVLLDSFTHSEIGSKVLEWGLNAADPTVIAVALDTNRKNFQAGVGLRHADPSAAENESMKRVKLAIGIFTRQRT